MARQVLGFPGISLCHEKFADEAAARAYVASAVGRGARYIDVAPEYGACARMRSVLCAGVCQQRSAATASSNQSTRGRSMVLRLRRQATVWRRRASVQPWHRWIEAGAHCPASVTTAAAPNTGLQTVAID